MARPAAPTAVVDSGETPAEQASTEQVPAEKASSSAAFTAAVIGALAQGSATAAAQGVGNAGQPGLQPTAAPVELANPVLQAAAAGAMAGASAAAAVVSLQSALPTVASLVKAPERGEATKAITNNAVPSARSDAGPASNTASAPAAANLKSSAAGTETPFAVFFSGNEAEPAAAVLPKMIVPAATNASSHNNVQPSAVSAGVATQNASMNGNAPQSGAPQPTRNSTSGTSDEGTSVAPGGRTADTNATTAAMASAQTAAPAAASAAATTGQPSAGGQIPVVVAQAGAQAAPAGTAQQPEALPAAASNTANAAALPQTTPQVLPGPVQVAQMASRAGQAEMRIGMNTSAFGSVEVRTVIHASDVGLTIGSEKGDLRGLLTNELPVVANNLQQQNLRLTSVSFTQGFASPGNMTGGGGTQQQRTFTPPTSYASSSAGSNDPSESEMEDLPPWQQMNYVSGSLSVLA
jgi:trimeric autotransporter adhesin